MSKISNERKATYYLGGALQVVGGLMFASTFVIGISRIGDFSNFEGQMRQSAILAVGGMALLIVGGVVRGIGARGIAGSGLKLDPEQAREDLKPYAKLAGGLLHDTVDELKVPSTGATAVKVRCLKCRALNDEAAKFCSQCGSAV
jgi:hypothetical protein